MVWTLFYSDYLMSQQEQSHESQKLRVRCVREANTKQLQLDIEVCNSPQNQAWRYATFELRYATSGL